MPITLFDTQGGVTQVKFSPDGRYLYSCGRKDNAIYCWDIRGTGGLLWKAKRDSNTNQHIHIDVDPTGTILVTSSLDGRAQWFRCSDGKLVATHRLSDDVLNTCAFHPFHPYLASSTGTRQFQVPYHAYGSDDSDSSDSDSLDSDLSISLWSLT